MCKCNTNTSVGSNIDSCGSVRHSGFAIHNGQYCPTASQLYYICMCWLLPNNKAGCVALSGNNNSAAPGSYSARDVYPTSPCVLPPSAEWCEIPAEEPAWITAGLKVFTRTNPTRGRHKGFWAYTLELKLHFILVNFLQWQRTRTMCASLRWSQVFMSARRNSFETAAKAGKKTHANEARSIKWLAKIYFTGSVSRWRSRQSTRIWL